MRKRNNMTTYNKLKQTKKKENYNPHARWTHVEKLHLNEINILYITINIVVFMNELNQNKICIFLSLQPFFFFFFLLFLSLVMEAIDSWLTLFFLFVLISLYFSLLPCCVLGLCLSTKYLALKHTSDQKIR